MDPQSETLHQAPNGSPLTTNSSCESLASREGRIRTDQTTLSYAKVLKMTHSESIETTIRMRRLFFARGVARQSKERLPGRITFGTMASEESPRSGGRVKTWQLMYFFFHLLYFPVSRLGDLPSANFWTSRGHRCRPFCPPVRAFIFTAQ